MTPDTAPKSIDAGSKLALDRTRLAYDRTMLAWLRTAISLITFGFSVQQFFRNTRPDEGRTSRLIGPTQFGMAMMIIGLCTLLLSAWEHRRSMERLRREYSSADGYPPIPRSSAPALALLIGLLGVLGLLSMLFRE